MKKKIALLLILLFYLKINVVIYTDSLQLELIKKMNANLFTEKNYDKEKLTMHRTPAGPSCFTIDDNLIYIPDDWKNRIVVYDLNINFMKEIIIKSDKVGILGVQRIEKLKDKILIISNSIAALNMDGTIHYHNKYNTNDHRNFFIIDKNLYYYSLNKTIKRIDENGNLIEEENTIELLRKNGGWQRGVFNKFEKINDEVINFLNTNCILFYNDKLFYWQFDEYHKEYFNLLKKVNLNNTFIASKYLLQLIGFDKNDNSYWKVLDRNYYIPKHLCILNKNGEIIKWAEDILFSSIVQVNLNGDIYLMFSKLSDKTYTFYRICNIWDP